MCILHCLLVHSRHIIHGQLIQDGIEDFCPIWQPAIMQDAMTKHLQSTFLKRFHENVQINFTYYKWCSLVANKLTVHFEICPT